MNKSKNFINDYSQTSPDFKFVTNLEIAPSIQLIRQQLLKSRSTQNCSDAFIPYNIRSTFDIIQLEQHLQSQYTSSTFSELVLIQSITMVTSTCSEYTLIAHINNLDSRTFSEHILTEQINECVITTSTYSKLLKEKIINDLELSVNKSCTLNDIVIPQRLIKLIYYQYLVPNWILLSYSPQFLLLTKHGPISQNLSIYIQLTKHGPSKLASYTPMCKQDNHIQLTKHGPSKQSFLLSINV